MFISTPNPLMGDLKGCKKSFKAFDNNITCSVWNDEYSKYDLVSVLCQKYENKKLIFNFKAKQNNFFLCKIKNSHCSDALILYSKRWLLTASR